MTPEMKAALAKLEPEVRKAFEEAIAQITSQAQIALLEDAIRAGDVAKALAILNLDPTFFAPLARAIAEPYWRGGVMILAGLGALRDPFLVGAWLSVLMAATPAPKHGPDSAPGN